MIEITDFELSLCITAVREMVEYWNDVVDECETDQRAIEELDGWDKLLNNLIKRESE